jgi:hypothetical protein
MVAWYHGTHSLRLQSWPVCKRLAPREALGVPAFLEGVDGPADRVEHGMVPPHEIAYALSTTGDRTDPFSWGCSRGC